MDAVGARDGLSWKDRPHDVRRVAGVHIKQHPDNSSSWMHYCQTEYEYHYSKAELIRMVTDETAVVISGSNGHLTIQTLDDQSYITVVRPYPV